MKKKNLSNLIMVLVILGIVILGVLTVGSIQGWFAGDEGNSVLREIKGIVNMERGGVAYLINEDTKLRKGDRITCDPGATAVIATADGCISLNGAEMNIEDPAMDAFAAELVSGDGFVHAKTGIALTVGEETVDFTDTEALVSVRIGTQSISVFSGMVQEAASEQILQWNRGIRTIEELSIQFLNDFTISQIRKGNETGSLCYSNSELDQLVEDRKSEIQGLLTSGNPDGNFCTIAIYCDTILDNWNKLDPAKGGYVPEDGVILSPVTVEFTEGESVFDVLSRVCEACGIQIEYSWTPIYDSYYIEGIQHIYEFDCGFQSGWMFRVNGWYPNYGCSSYKLTGGEVITWHYTCSYGEDIGAESWIKNS